MKKNYLRRVRRALLCSRRRKNDILRDLNEIFSSAAEHGESDAQVIARLGSPEEFAASMEETTASDRAAILRRRRALRIILPASAAAIVCLLLYFLTNNPFSPAIGIIGGADGPTAIFIASSPTFPQITTLLPAAALLCLAAIVFAVVRWIRAARK